MEFFLPSSDDSCLSVKRIAHEPWEPWVGTCRPGESPFFTFLLFFFALDPSLLSQDSFAPSDHSDPVLAGMLGCRLCRGVWLHPGLLCWWVGEGGGRRRRRRRWCCVQDCRHAEEMMPCFFHLTSPCEILPDLEADRLCKQMHIYTWIFSDSLRFAATKINSLKYAHKF